MTNQDFNASVEIWKFFSKYAKSSLVSVSEFTAVDNWITLTSENPSRDMIKLNSKNDQEYTVLIYNLEGKQMYSSNNNTGESVIDIKDLVDGVYLVQLSNGTQNATLKVVKQ